jgi:hypothetical protein
VLVDGRVAQILPGMAVTESSLTTAGALSSSWRPGLRQAGKLQGTVGILRRMADTTPQQPLFLRMLELSFRLFTTARRREDQILFSILTIFRNNVNCFVYQLMYVFCLVRRSFVFFSER